MKGEESTFKAHNPNYQGNKKCIFNSKTRGVMLSGKKRKRHYKERLIMGEH